MHFIISFKYGKYFFLYLKKILSKKKYCTPQRQTHTQGWSILRGCSIGTSGHSRLWRCGSCGVWYPETPSWTAAAAKSLQSCPTLCDPIDGSLPGSSVPGILQTRVLEWVAISFSNAWKWKVKVKSLSHPTLRNPMDCSLPGSSIHGIFQARVL